MIKKNILIRSRSISISTKNKYNHKIYDIDRMKLFLENPLIVNTSSHERKDLILVFRSNDERKKQLYEENITDFVVKFSEGDYGTLFSLNERDFISDKKFDEIAKSTTATDNCFDHDLGFIAYNTYSLATIPQPESWLGFLTEHFKLRVEETQISFLIDYLCFKLAQQFENLKQPYVHVCDDIITLGYKFEKMTPNTNIDDESERGKEYAVTFLIKKDGADDFYSNFYIQRDSQKTIEMAEILSKDKDCNVFFLVQNNSFFKHSLFLILVKTLILNFYEMENFYIPKLITNDIETPNDELKISICKRLAKNNCNNIIAFILNNMYIYRHKIKVE